MNLFCTIMPLERDKAKSAFCSLRIRHADVVLVRPMKPRLVFNSWVFRLPMLRDCEAITLPWAIYFRDAEADAETLRHEMVHVAQRERLGMVRFYWQYFCEYLRGLAAYRSHDAAYRSISFEREAYAAE